MTLTEYLSLERITQRDFAVLVGSSQGFISHYLTGRHKLSAKNTLKWAKATNYKVTPHSLSPHLYPNKNDGVPENLWR